MKKHLIYIVVCMAVLFFAACVAHQPVKNRQAYVNGKNLAEKLAKQDAVEAGCNHYPVLTGHLQNLNRHLERFGPEKDADFIRGFKGQYKKAYEDYMELYCKDD